MAASGGSAPDASVEISGRRLSLSNLDKILYPAAGFTKAQVIDYYARIAPAMLPHLAGRAVTLVRLPDGVEGPSFFEKRCPPHHPAWVPELGELGQCGIQEPAALVWLANLAALELHTLQAKAATPAAPDAVVFDLDPGAPAGAIDAARIAVELRSLLDRLGLRACVKTSGAKGIHLSVPLHSPTDADRTKRFARALGEVLAGGQPDRVTTDMARAVRRGRVFVDWSQNDRHKTTVCAYSLRAQPHPTVSAPASWEELEAAIDANDAGMLTFDAPTVLARVAQMGDLYADNLTLEQHLPVV